MNTRLRLERPQLLTDLAFERIREAIVMGELGLGSQVSEAQLAASLGISKTPVREALLRLKIEGLVEIHPQRGTFVFHLEPDQVGQLCRFRVMLETAALAEARAVNRGQLLNQLNQRVNEMVEADRVGDVDRLSRIDMDFHYQFLACCPNTYLRGAYELIRYQLIALRHRAPIENCVSSHRELVDIIASADIEVASRELSSHILENVERYSTACRAA
jgi:DNA-binding GntR family transcriptional regulator